LDIIIEEHEGSLWVAGVERTRLVSFDVDPVHEHVRWGAIYWAKVTKIDTKLDAAFLDLDGNNTGILYNRDVRIQDKAKKITKGGNQPIGKTLRPGQMILVQAKQGYLEPDFEDSRPLEEKSPVVSMDIAIPGRYLIYTPLDHDNRISSRIRDKKMRKQLEDMMKNLTSVEGCILRAAAADTQSDVLIRESKILRAIWDGLQEHAEGDEVALIMEGPDALQRVLSDNAGQIIRRIEVAIMDHFQIAEDWCELFAPDLIPKVKPIELKNATMDLALFEHYDLMPQIQSLFHPYAVLNGGGNILIQVTAALTAIDVNRGPDKNSNLTINLEAANEIMRQIKLRNIGGTIMIDFIRMSDEKDRKHLWKHIEQLVNLDPNTVQMHGFTHLGLLELSRQRRTPPLDDRVGHVFDETE
jgi:Rne/Rng family ribonuclease